MESIRRFVKWAGAHRIITFVILAAAGGAFYFVRMQVVRAQGFLSAPLEKGTIVQSVYGIGTVTANRSYQLTTGVMGTINSIAVKEGDLVKKGDPLLTIDATRYRAPFEGTVTSLPYKVGENIVGSAAVLQIVDLRDRYILVSLEQQGALRVRAGQKVKLSFDTLRDSNFDGEVTSIYSNSSGYLARIEVKNLPDRILPFMTADVAITLQTHENVLLLPLAALQEGKYVWIKHTLPKRVEVKVGIVDKGLAEVLEGDLHAGDRVIISSQAAQ